MVFIEFYLGAFEKERNTISLSVYPLKRYVDCQLSLTGHGCPHKKVPLPSLLEGALNEGPLQLFELQGKKMALETRLGWGEPTF